METIGIFTRDLIESFIHRASMLSRVNDDGFDAERSDMDMLMRVLCAVGRMVDASDAERRASVVDNRGYDGWYAVNVLDTVEDWLAVVCLRLFDFCGRRQLLPLMFRDRLVDMDTEFEDSFALYSTREQAYALCVLVTDVARTKTSREYALGSVFSFLAALARHHHIDLVRCVEMRLSYDETKAKSI